MAAEQGSGFLLKVTDGAGGWQTVAGLRTTAFSVTRAAVEATNRGTAGWRALIGGAGVGSVAIAGTGVFNGSVAEARVSADALAGSLDSYRIVFASGGTFTGQFLVTKLEYAGDWDGERTYTVALESSGPVVGA